MRGKGTKTLSVGVADSSPKGRAKIVNVHFSLPPLCKGRWVGVSRAGGGVIHIRYKQSLTFLPKGEPSVQRNDTKVVPYNDS